MRQKKKRFDPTLKRIYERYGQQWLDFFLPRLGLPSAPSAEVIDSDVSTVTSAADKVFRIGGRKPWIFHLELLASHLARLARKLLLYNVLIGEQQNLPVHSAVLLLRPEADRASIDGNLLLEGSDGKVYLDFHYGVLRLWQLSPEQVLTAGLGLLPLAPVTALPVKELPEVIQKIQRRIDAEAEPTEAADLWSATYVLLGLSYDRVLSQQLLRGVRNMRESTTYQAILEEGEAKGHLDEARQILLDFGRERLGKPDDKVRGSIARIADIQLLHQLIKRVPSVASWQELLSGDGDPRKPRQRKRTS